MIGGRARLILASPHGPSCVSTQAVAEEIARHLPRLAAKRGLDEAQLLAALQVMPIQSKPATDYEAQQAEAENASPSATLTTGPQSRSLTLDLPVWSQDKNLTVAGLEVFTTGDLLDALAEIAPDE